MNKKSVTSRAAYQTPLSIVPAKVSRYDEHLPYRGRNSVPDRRYTAAARRAERQADRIGDRERSAVSFGSDAAVFDIIGRLGQMGVDYGQLLALVEQAGTRAFLGRIKLEQIHELVAIEPFEPWEAWRQVRPIVASMQEFADDEIRRLEALALPNPLDRTRRMKAVDLDEAEGW